MVDVTPRMSDEEYDGAWLAYACVSPIRKLLRSLGEFDREKRLVNTEFIKDSCRRNITAMRSRPKPMLP